MNREIILSFQILKSVYFDNAYANIELNKCIKKKEENINYGLITKIVYGVLERDIYLDYAIKDFVKPTTKPIIRLLFKMGRYIKENVNSIPDYTIVNEMVNISKNYGDRYVSGFVNATLKNIIKSEVQLPKAGTTEYLSIKYSYPKWIISELLKTKDYAFVEGLLSTDLTTLTHIRILGDSKQFEEDLKALNVDYESTPLEFTKYVDYNELLKHSEFDGRYVVQGLPSIICSLSLDVKPNSEVLDCCSAPGGKSGVIASTYESVKVIASDLHAHRVMLIENYMKKLGIKNVTAVKQDATIFNPNWQEKFDYVLCDVPCSGIGVVNKKPDILLNRSLDGLHKIVETQSAILENNAKYVKRGGVLVYSTCSIMPKENESVLKEFLHKHPEFELTEIDTFGVKVEDNNNMYTFYPNISNTEGFFIGRLIKK